MFNWLRKLNKIRGAIRPPEPVPEPVSSIRVTRQQIATMIDENPQQAMAVLRQWMNDEPPAIPQRMHG